jgi:hypothetical protein
VSVVCTGRSLHSCRPTPRRRTEPTTRRMTSKPMPGQPPANVEYSRRNLYLGTIIRRGGAKRIPPPGRACDPFGSAPAGNPASLWELRRTDSVLSFESRFSVKAVRGQRSLDGLRRSLARAR